MRDLLGRTLYRSGSALMGAGGWLCGLAGTWDAMTDDHQRVMHGRSRSGLTLDPHGHPWEPDCDERGCVPVGALFSRTPDAEETS